MPQPLCCEDVSLMDFKRKRNKEEKSDFIGSCLTHLHEDGLWARQGHSEPVVIKLIGQHSTSAADIAA